MELLIQQQSKRLPTRSYRTQNYPNPFQSVIDFFSKFNTKIIDFFLLMMVVMMMMMMMNIEIETSHIIDQSLENVSIEDLNEINSRIAKDFDRNFSQIIRLKQSTWPSVITIDMIDDNNGEINSTESFQQQQYHHLRNSTEKRRKFPLKIPKLGFGNFHYSRNHHNSNETNGDDYDQDDEDDVSYDFKEYSNINLFDRNQTKDHKTEDVSIEIDNVDVDGDDIAINYDDEDRNDRIGTNSFDYIMIPKIERQLIIGDLDKLPRPDSYLEDQTTPIDFDGCFCDHHFHSTHQSRQSFEIAQDRSGSFSYANHLNFLQQHRSNSLRLKSSYLEIGSQDQSTIPLSTVMTTTTTTPTTSPTINLSSTTVFCYCYGESIKDIPQNFTKTVRKIILNRIGLQSLKADSLRLYRNLTEIYMQSVYQLSSIENGAFTNLPDLISIYIKIAPKLENILDDIFKDPSRRFRHIKITHTGLERLPLLQQKNSSEVIVSIIDLDNNRIQNLTQNSILINVESFHIEYNQIEFIEDYAFNGSKIGKLSLKGNKKLVHLEKEAFFGLYLRELDLSQTSITKLPTSGLSESLEILRIVETFTLKEIPFIYHFESIKEAHLTYPYHCCAFQFPANHNPIEYERLKNLFNTDRYCLGAGDSNVQDEDDDEEEEEDVIDNDENGGFVNDDVDVGRSSRKSDLNDQLESDYGWDRRDRPRKRFTLVEDMIHSPNDTYEKRRMSTKSLPSPSSSSLTSSSIVLATSMRNARMNSKNDKLPGRFGIPHSFIRPKQQFCGDIKHRMPAVRCYPLPDAFNPCEDVMGKTYLRFIVWIVAFAAVSGNVAVIVVLISSRFTFNVSKFLMINLSIADLMMGVYLFIIAIVNLWTQGNYFNYAIDWQHGIGCKIAGFITVFSQLLSIFTLTVITLERLFAITYAIQLNRRFKLNFAVKIMIFGWFLVILLASLPLFGISSYSKTSICLPMEHKTTSDILYLVSLLIINQLAFITICACYLKMYISIVSQKTRATMNDMTIAKRMALLIFTDFACWAPIAFFGLTAIAGYPLINVTNSKILLVTIYPLNSCANPFLYVIFTKQYRRDFFILASRYGFCKSRALRYKATKNFNQNRQAYLHHYHHHHRRHNHYNYENRNSMLKDQSDSLPKSHQSSSIPIQSLGSTNLNPSRNDYQNQSIQNHNNYQQRNAFQRQQNSNPHQCSAAYHSYDHLPNSIQNFKKTICSLNQEHVFYCKNHFEMNNAIDCGEKKCRLDTEFFRNQNQLTLKKIESSKDEDVGRDRKNDYDDDDVSSENNKNYSNGNESMLQNRNRCKTDCLIVREDQSVRFDRKKNDLFHRAAHDVERDDHSYLRRHRKHLLCHCRCRLNSKHHHHHHHYHRPKEFESNQSRSQFGSQESCSKASITILEMNSDISANQNHWQRLRHLERKNRSFSNENSLERDCFSSCEMISFRPIGSSFLNENDDGQRATDRKKLFKDRLSSSSSMEKVQSTSNASNEQRTMMRMTKKMIMLNKKRKKKREKQIKSRSISSSSSSSSSKRKRKAQAILNESNRSNENQSKRFATKAMIVGCNQNNCCESNSIDQSRSLSRMKRNSIFAVVLHRLSISKRFSMRKNSMELDSSNRNFMDLEQLKSSRKCGPNDSYHCNKIFQNKSSRCESLQRNCCNRRCHYQCRCCFESGKISRSFGKFLIRSSSRKGYNQNGIQSTYQADRNDRKSSFGEGIDINREIFVSKPMTIETERELLRKALQETTTIQEAVAVVEELSSSVRISRGSSSSSKKT